MESWLCSRHKPALLGLEIARQQKRTCVTPCKFCLDQVMGIAISSESFCLLSREVQIKNGM